MSEYDGSPSLGGGIHHVSYGGPDCGVHECLCGGDHVLDCDCGGSFCDGNDHSSHHGCGHGGHVDGSYHVGVYGDGDVLNDGVCGAHSCKINQIVN